MHTLFNLFLDICLFRKGPQDVPASRVLLQLTLLVYGLAGLLVLLMGATLGSALWQTLLDIVLLSVLTYGVLNFRGYPFRYQQTLTALAGTDTLLRLMVWPVVFWMSQALARGETAALPILLSWMLVGWSIAVMIHILRHALAVSRGIAALYTVGYVIVSILAREWFFPQTGMTS